MISTILRRSFATTARRYRPSNEKPPPQERNEPPKPPKDEEPTKPKPESASNKPKLPRSEFQKIKDDMRERVVGSFQPRSEFFIFAFANPKLSWEKRKRGGLSLLAALLVGLLLDPYMKQAVLGEKRESAGERGNAADSPSTIDTAQAETFVAMVSQAYNLREKRQEERASHWR